MSNYPDNMIGRVLKNWVAQYQLPAGGRARLLSMANAVPRRRFSLSALIPRTQFNDYPMQGPNANEWMQVQFPWFFEHSFKFTGFQARV